MKSFNVLFLDWSQAVRVVFILVGCIIIFFFNWMPGIFPKFWIGVKIAGRLLYYSVLVLFFQICALLLLLGAFIIVSSPHGDFPWAGVLVSSHLPVFGNAAILFFWHIFFNIDFINGLFRAGTDTVPLYFYSSVFEFFFYYNPWYTFSELRYGLPFSDFTVTTVYTLSGFPDFLVVYDNIENVSPLWTFFAFILFIINFFLQQIFSFFNDFLLSLFLLFYFYLVSLFLYWFNFDVSLFLGSTYSGFWSVLWPFGVFGTPHCATQLGFQLPVTPIFEDITFLHDNIMFFLVWITVGVFFMLSFISVVFSRFRCFFFSFFSLHTPLQNVVTLEVLWAILPTLQVMAILFPSISFIYFADGLGSSLLSKAKPSFLGPHSDCQVNPIFLDHKPVVTVKAIGRQWFWSYEIKYHRNFLITNQAFSQPRSAGRSLFLLNPLFKDRYLSQMFLSFLSLDEMMDDFYFGHKLSNNREFLPYASYWLNIPVYCRHVSDLIKFSFSGSGSCLLPRTYNFERLSFLSLEHDFLQFFSNSVAFSTIAPVDLAFWSKKLFHIQLYFVNNGARLYPAIPRKNLFNQIQWAVLPYAKIIAAQCTTLQILESSSSIASVVSKLSSDLRLSTRRSYMFFLTRRCQNFFGPDERYSYSSEANSFALFDQTRCYLAIKISRALSSLRPVLSAGLSVSFDSSIIYFDDDLASSNFSFVNFLSTNTDGVLLLPSGVPIRLLVTATDVIHSWAIPAFGLKVDAIPGRLNGQIFTIFPHVSGFFFGQCSELCGEGHSIMPIQINVVHPSFFDLHLRFHQKFLR